MRILANYGYKNNGDSYSVTFETTGDVPLEQADKTVDDLFRRAREAIARQAGGYNNGAQKNGGATEKQKSFLKKLSADTRKGVDIDTLSKQEASELIKELTN